MGAMPYAISSMVYVWLFHYGIFLRMAFWFTKESVGVSYYLVIEESIKHDDETDPSLHYIADMQCLIIRMLIMH